MWIRIWMFPAFFPSAPFILFYRLFIVSTFVNMRRKLYVYDNDARQVSYMETVNDNRFSLFSQGRVKERKKYPVPITDRFLFQNCIFLLGSRPPLRRLPDRSISWHQCNNRQVKTWISLFLSAEYLEIQKMEPKRY